MNSEVNIGNIIVNEELEITPVEIDIEKIYPETENLEITPKFEEQTFNHPDSYGYDNVVVKPVVMTEIDITPSNEVQSYTGIFNKVTVETDENLTPGNIKKDVEIFGITGTANVSNLEINDCSYLFYNGARISIKDEILSLCKNVITTKSMFEDSNLSNIKYTYEEFPFDTSKVTNMNSMFKSSGLRSFDSTNFDTSSVVNMSNMFYGCQNFSEANLSNFNTSNVTDMSNMFYLCQYMKHNDLKYFDTSKVTTMDSMFQMCYQWSEIDLSGWDTSNVKNMQSMFYMCNNLKKINISGFSSESLTKANSMFYNCSKLSTLIIDSPKVFALLNPNMLDTTEIGKKRGYIYVPDELVETYKSATNWSVYADQIKGLSEFEEA